MSDPGHRNDPRWLPLAVGGAAALADVAWRLALGLRGALGTDAALWGLTARDLLAGAEPLVPPGYPALVAALHAVGLPLIPAGVAVSLAAAAAMPALAWWAARALGARRALAGATALATLALPDRVGWAQQVQPDSLAAAMMVALAALLSLGAGGHRRAAWGAAVLAGLLPLVREHGLPVAGLAAGALALTGPPGRLPRALAVVALAWLGPLLVGVLPGPHPLAAPWADRAGGALAALRATHPDELPYLRELHREPRRAYLALLSEGDRLGQLRWHAGRSLRLAWDGWLWLVLGGAGLALAARRRPARWLLGLPLLTALPALLIWSQRRHVLLVVPVALLCLGVGLARAPRGLRLAGGAAALALALAWPGQLATLAEGQRSERHRAEHFAHIGSWLAQNAPPHSFLGGLFQDVGLYLPLPRHDPDGTAADWSTFLVSDRPPPPSPLGPWEAVAAVPADDPAARGPRLSIYRLDPGRSPRPCAGVAPPPGAAYLAVDRAHIDLPDCAQPIAPR